MNGIGSEKIFIEIFVGFCESGMGHLDEKNVAKMLIEAVMVKIIKMKNKINKKC